MNVRFPFVVLLGVTMVSLGFVIGCGEQHQAGNDQDAAQPANGGDQSDSVDPHDVPITEEQKQQLREETAKFADAVARIKKFGDTVQKETRDGLPENLDFGSVERQMDTKIAELEAIIR